MSPSTLRQNPYSDSYCTAPVFEPYEHTSPRPLSRPLGRGRDYRCDVASAPAPRVTARRVPPPDPEENQPVVPPLPRATIHRKPPPKPEEIKPEMPPLALATTRRVFPPEPEEFKPEMPHGLIGSLVSWLRGGASACKQLRLVETISLGEKRFVAIIHAQGRKYLVGGGTSGVALLTCLDEPTSQSGSIAPVAKPVEVAG